MLPHGDSCMQDGVNVFYPVDLSRSLVFPLVRPLARKTKCPRLESRASDREKRGSCVYSRSLFARLFGADLIPLTTCAISLSRLSLRTNDRSRVASRCARESVTHTHTYTHRVWRWCISASLVPCIFLATDFSGKLDADLLSPGDTRRTRTGDLITELCASN